MAVRVQIPPSVPSISTNVLAVILIALYNAPPLLHMPAFIGRRKVKAN